MKITIKHYDKTYSINIDRDDLHIDETIELIQDLLKSIYSEDLIKKHWNNEE